MWLCPHLNWRPESVLLEGMFLIQTPSSPEIATFLEYAQMLFDCYALPHIQAGVLEVHILLDDPGKMTESPKEIERAKRDESTPLDQTH